MAACRWCPAREELVIVILCRSVKWSPCAGLLRVSLRWLRPLTSACSFVFSAIGVWMSSLLWLSRKTSNFTRNKLHLTNVVRKLLAVFCAMRNSDLLVLYLLIILPVLLWAFRLLKMQELLLLPFANELIANLRFLQFRFTISLISFQLAALDWFLEFCLSSNCVAFRSKFFKTVALVVLPCPCTYTSNEAGELWIFQLIFLLVCLRGHC